MKKSIALILALVLLGAAVAGYFWWQEENQYVKIHDLKFPKNLEELDLASLELTPEEEEVVRAALPQCRIYRSISFQGAIMPDDITALTVSTLSTADLEILTRFEGLKSVDASSCRDYPLILEMMERYPEIAVTYQVELDGRAFDSAVTEVETPGEDLVLLAQRLTYLPQVRKVTLTEPVTDAEGLKNLLAQWPDIEFIWNVMVLDRLVSHDTVELDISGTPLETVEEVEAAVACLPNMQKVIMCDCGISNEEMDALNRRHEDVQYVWSVLLGESLWVRTDITTFMPSMQYGFFVKYNEEVENLKYCTEIVCLDLGHRGISRCDFVAYMPHLKYLILADTGVKDLTPLTGLQELVFLELFLAPVKDLTPLTTLTALEDLNLGHCRVDPTPLYEMTWLKRLWWPHNPGVTMTVGQAKKLVSSLPDTEVWLRTGSSTGGTWRQGQNYYDMRDILGMEYMVG